MDTSSFNLSVIKVFLLGGKERRASSDGEPFQVRILSTDNFLTSSIEGSLKASSTSKLIRRKFIPKGKMSTSNLRELVTSSESSVSNITSSSHSL